MKRSSRVIMVHAISLGSQFNPLQDNAHFFSNLCNIHSNISQCLATFISTFSQSFATLFQLSLNSLQHSFQLSLNALQHSFQLSLNALQHSFQLSLNALQHSFQLSMPCNILSILFNIHSTFNLFHVGYDPHSSIASYIKRQRGIQCFCN